VNQIANQFKLHHPTMHSYSCTVIEKKNRKKETKKFPPTTMLARSSRRRFTNTCAPQTCLWLPCFLRTFASELNSHRLDSIHRKLHRHSLQQHASLQKLAHFFMYVCVSLPHSLACSIHLLLSIAVFISVRRVLYPHGPPKLASSN
jgi:hypothetical protein